MKNTENSIEIRTVVMVGAGNLSWHLGHNLLKAGIQIVQVFNRNHETGEGLAGEWGSPYTDRMDSITEKADLYILAVSDDAINGILKTDCFNRESLVVHVAGSVSMDIFSGRAVNYGVFYPLQTFTKGIPVDFSKVPLFIEANTAGNLKRIEMLARKLSETVYEVDSEVRMFLHLSAVLTSNFPNHLFSLADRLLREKGLSFDILKPLIRETIAKVMVMPPLQAQTGPAVRGNKTVIEKHLELLHHYPEISEIYRAITESIMASGNQK